MRVVLGYPDVVPHPQALLKSRHEVAAAVMRIRRVTMSTKSIWADSVEDLARSEGIEVFLAKRPAPG